jgi:hypothetical protein
MHFPIEALRRTILTELPQFKEVGTGLDSNHKSYIEFGDSEGHRLIVVERAKSSGTNISVPKTVFVDCSFGMDRMDFTELYDESDVSTFAAKVRDFVNQKR